MPLPHDALYAKFAGMQGSALRLNRNTLRVVSKQPHTVDPLAAGRSDLRGDVASGQYHQFAERILPNLCRRLLEPGGHRDTDVSLHTCPRSIENLVASYAIPILETN